MIDSQDAPERSRAARPPLRREKTPLEEVVPDLALLVPYVLFGSLAWGNIRGIACMSVLLAPALLWQLIALFQLLARARSRMLLGLGTPGAKSAGGPSLKVALLIRLVSLLVGTAAAIALGSSSGC